MAHICQKCGFGPISSFWAFYQFFSFLLRLFPVGYVVSDTNEAGYSTFTACERDFCEMQPSPVSFVVGQILFFVEKSGFPGKDWLFSTIESSGNFVWKIIEVVFVLHLAGRILTKKINTGSVGSDIEATDVFYEDECGNVVDNWAQKGPLFFHGFINFFCLLLCPFQFVGALINKLLKLRLVFFQDLFGSFPFWNIPQYRGEVLLLLQKKNGNTDLYRDLMTILCHMDSFKYVFLF